MMLVLLYGRKGFFAPVIAALHLPPIIFAFPGAHAASPDSSLSRSLGRAFGRPCGQLAAPRLLCPRPAPPVRPQACCWPPCL